MVSPAKKPKEPNKSVARLRGILGQTQKQFAQTIGVSLIALKRIESGSLKLSGEIARRIYLTTGATSLKGDGTIMYFDKAAYERKHFDWWRIGMFTSTEEDAWRYFEDVICPHMLLMLLAATKPAIGGKVRDRLQSLVLSWSEWEKDVVKAFDLKPQIQEILNQFPIHDSKTMTWGQWRKWLAHEESLIEEINKKNPGKPRPKIFNRGWWNFKENPKKPDGELLTLKNTAYAGFTSGGGHVMPGMVKQLRERRPVVTKT